MTDERQARQQPETGSEKSTRRDLVDRLLLLGGLIWTAGVVVPASVFLWPARARGPAEEFVSVSKKGFEVGTERMVQLGGKPVMVLHIGEDEFRAFSAVCTHLACIVKWDRQAGHVACPCHAGFFASDGTVISGPPPQPLTPYRVVVLKDDVRVYAT